jgi:hypothetical protein
VGLSKPSKAASSRKKGWSITTWLLAQYFIQFAAQFNLPILPENSKG